MPTLARIEASKIGYRLAKGAFWSMAGAVISRGLMLAAWVLVARMLGKTGYGELGMIQSTVGMFGVFAGFGLGLTATKHVAEFYRNDPERTGRIIGLSGLVAMGTGGLMAMGLFIFAPWLAEHTINAPHLAGVLRIGALILFINALNGAQTGALSGFEAFKTIAYVNLLVGLISFPVLAGGAYFGGLTGAVWALAINLGVNWLFNHLALRKEAHRYGVSLTFRKCSTRIAGSLEIQPSGSSQRGNGRPCGLGLQCAACQPTRWIWGNGDIRRRSRFPADSTFCQRNAGRPLALHGFQCGIKRVQETWNREYSLHLDSWGNCRHTATLFSRNNASAVRRQF